MRRALQITERLVREKQLLLDALRPFAELPTTDETPGVARDDEMDEMIYRAREAVQHVTKEV